MLEYALKYATLGWSLIPIDWKESRAKLPLVDWKGYQNKRATEKEIESWFQTWPLANIGLVTGDLSGVIVVDIDLSVIAEQRRAVPYLHDLGKLELLTAQK